LEEPERETFKEAWVDGEGAAGYRHRPRATRAMLELIEKLLILQERDRKIGQLEAELADIGPHRRLAAQQLDSAKTRLEELKQRVRQLENERNQLELDVKAKKEQIEKYSFQQFQTKKNPEYQALAHEILLCKSDINKTEDKELEVLELIDTTQRGVSEAVRLLEETQQITEQQLEALAQREARLKTDLNELIENRAELAVAVDSDFLPRYERLRKSKDGRVVVGVEHSVCGGCHVKLPAQIVVGCQAAQEVMMCPNCGRVLYYSPGMDLVVAE